MLRKFLFPIVSGIVIGKAVSFYRDNNYTRKHPLKSMFFSR